MAFWSAVGDYLEGSGWVSVLTQSSVAVAGTAESFLNVSRLMKTRNAHQVYKCTGFSNTARKGFLQTGNSFSTQQEWGKIVLCLCTVLSSRLLFVRAHHKKLFTLP